MSLSRKLARLETIVAQAEAAVPTFWTAERIEQWSQWAVRLLESMPEQRAVVAYVELTTLPAEQWGALTRVVSNLAVLLADGVHGAPGSGERPYRLPEAVCAVLEAHPDAEVRSSFDCQDCGFMVPARSSDEWRRHRDEARAAGHQVDPAARVLLAVCPLCGGQVSWQGFNGKRWRALWQEQRAEMAAS
jgi:predicted RNA-binding Zn-ribbon protein involved in translation (DUF1610 family)